MKSIIMLIFSLFTVILSCQRKDEKINKIKKMELSKIEEILKKQLESGASADYGSFDDYREEDLTTLIHIENNILKNSGYIFPSQNQFSDKINSIFNRVIDPTSTSSFLKVDLSIPCDKKIDFKVWTPDYPYIYISKKRHFITNFLPIPEIINYEKEYPKLSYIEDKTFYAKDEIEQSKIEIRKWKNVKNLEQNRQSNIQVLINRNKYLFNDSKASLVWLKFNDEYFLESLVKVFGYMEDKDLLKWVLDRSLSDDKSKEEEFYKILVTKTCDNKYIFHKEVFEVMTQADDKSKKEYLLLLKGRIDLPKLHDLNFNEAAKIEALYCYYATKFTASIEQGDVYAFFPKLNDPKFEEEFRKNNYYNISDFKKLYDDTKNGGIWLHGMPE
uniref:hypothetical protein n=1 Tax=Flavobacterium sp. Root935 TaxID=1736610 RepID=UPI000FF87C84|nr:hypothetical protein [Flavobacterium sp. Root935]